MKTWIKRTLIGLATVVGATAAIGGIAGCSHRMGGSHGWSAMSEEDATRMKGVMIERAASKLDLDDAQKTRLGVLADKLREQKTALMDGGDPRVQINALIAGNSFDRAAAQALVEAKTAAVRTKSPEVITAIGDFYDGLRPEQQQKLRDMLKQGRHGWRG